MRILRYSGGGVVRLPFEEPRRRAYIAGRTASGGSGNGTREDRVSEFGGGEFFRENRRGGRAGEEEERGKDKKESMRRIDIALLGSGVLRHIRRGGSVVFPHSGSGVFCCFRSGLAFSFVRRLFILRKQGRLCGGGERGTGGKDGIFLFLKRKAADNGNADKDPDIYGIERTYGALVGIFGEDVFSAKIKTGGKLRGREVDAAAKESYRMLFGTDTQTAPSFEEWKSAVSEYADVPWAELADRAEKAAMLPKAEEVRSNR